MKKFAAFTTALIFSVTTFSQAEDKNPVAPKKVETIKIVDGDTVLHDVRIMEWEGDAPGKHPRHIRREVSEDITTEDFSELDDIDIFIHMDDDHKKMFIRHMDMDDEEMEKIMEDLEEGEDIVIEREDGKGKVKVMKIRIKDDEMEEITTIETKDGKPVHGEHHGNKPEAGPGGISVFPNPSEGELNIEFDVLKGSDAELTITGVNGEKIFSKTYKEPGNYKEKIKTSDSENGIYIVTLNQKGRSVTRKIILK